MLNVDVEHLFMCLLVILIYLFQAVINVSKLRASRQPNDLLAVWKMDFIKAKPEQEDREKVTVTFQGRHTEG